MVARSSGEAEYELMAHGTCEAARLKMLITSLGVKVETPMW